MRTVIILVLTALFTSCTIAFPKVAQGLSTQTISTNEVLSSYSSKEQVVRDFGAPTSKETIEGIEIWHYTQGVNSTMGAFSAPQFTGVETVGRKSTTENYVEFQFKNDKVVNVRSQGVNYSRKVQKPLSPAKIWYWRGYGFAIDAMFVGLQILALLQ